MSISNNTNKLQNLMDKINALPEAGGVELPELSNEGTAACLLEGKQLINQNGDVVVGSMPMIEGKTITPSEYTQTAVASGVYTTGEVTVAAIPSGYIVDEEISTQETLISEQDAKIAELIEKVKNKASVTYPTLSNPATAENLQEGYELIDGNGNIVVGTHVCSGGSVFPYTVTVNTNFSYVPNVLYINELEALVLSSASMRIESYTISGGICETVDVTDIHYRYILIRNINKPNVVLDIVYDISDFV